MIRLLFLKDHPGCNMKSGFGGGMFRENIQQAVAVILARDEDGQKCKWIHELVVENRQFLSGRVEPPAESEKEGSGVRRASMWGPTRG